MAAANDWRFLVVGEDDRLPLAVAAYSLVIIVVIWILMKLGFVRLGARRKR